VTRSSTVTTEVEEEHGRDRKRSAGEMDVVGGKGKGKAKAKRGEEEEEEEDDASSGDEEGEEEVDMDVSTGAEREHKAKVDALRKDELTNMTRMAPAVFADWCLTEVFKPVRGCVIGVSFRGASPSLYLLTLFTPFLWLEPSTFLSPLDPPLSLLLPLPLIHTFSKECNEPYCFQFLRALDLLFSSGQEGPGRVG